MATNEETNAGCGTFSRKQSYSRPTLHSTSSNHPQVKVFPDTSSHTESESSSTKGDLGINVNCLSKDQTPALPNPLSGFPKHLRPTNNQLPTSSTTSTHATVHEWSSIVTESIQRKAPRTPVLSKINTLLMEAKEKRRSVLDAEAEASTLMWTATAPLYTTSGTDYNKQFQPIIGCNDSDVDERHPNACCRLSWPILSSTSASKQPSQ
ncbi:hypothetical protein Tco_1102679 [Tanacetum coccineum]